MGFFQKKQFWALGFICVLAFGLWAPKVMAKDYIPQDGTPGCHDPITIEIGGIKLSVRRYGTILNFYSSPEISDLEKRCDIHFIGNVRRVQWPYETLGDTEAFQNGPPTTYKRHRDEINAARNEGITEKTSSNMERIRHGTSEIYVWSSAIAPTANGEPIVFDCGGHQEDINGMSLEFCYVAYVNPSGLFVTYRFDRRTYPDSKFSDTDKERRQRIEQMINAAK